MTVIFDHMVYMCVNNTKPLICMNGFNNTFRTQSLEVFPVWSDIEADGYFQVDRNYIIVWF